MLITCMGDVFRTNKRALRKLLKEVAQGKDWPEDFKLNHLGTPINLTDMSPEEAQYHLDTMK